MGRQGVGWGQVGGLASYLTMVDLLHLLGGQAVVERVLSTGGGGRGEGEGRGGPEGEGEGASMHWARASMYRSTWHCQMAPSLRGTG